MNVKKILVIIGPGILVAATGVGAGDLATGALTGNKLGLAVLWAVVIGAFLKFVVNEGLTRWQLATGDTLLEGCVAHIGRPFQWIFLIYLLFWSFLVGAALMSAAGVTLHAILPLFDAKSDKIIYGIAQSAIAVVLVSLGGYRLFEKVMTVCIGFMFIVVVATAIALKPSTIETLKGIFIPTIPNLNQGGLEWTVALLGGVGGTLTVLCYGYWIREEGRRDATEILNCRIDLAVGYAMTALFGMAMVVIGSQMPAIDGGGAGLLVALSNGLEQAFGAGLGPLIKWGFLIGAWCAVFSSLLGVWQAIPYLFTDFWNLATQRGTGKRKPVDTKSRAYRGFLYGLASVPALGVVFTNFTTIQKTYAIVGALVIPALSGVLLYLNNRTKLVGPENKNTWKSNSVLVIALCFFAYAGWLGIKKKFLVPLPPPKSADFGYAGDLIIASYEDIQWNVFGAGIVSPEGPAVNRLGQIFVVSRWTGKVVQVDSSGAVSDLVETGGKPQSVALLESGDLLLADANNRALQKISTSGDLTTLASEVNGEPFMGPNDLVVAGDVVYLTDPGLAMETLGQVLRIDLKTGTATRLAENLRFPNGVTISDDGGHLMVSESMTHRVLRYELLDQGTRLGEMEVFCEFADHHPDGIAYDAEGNLLVTICGAGELAVVSPAGETVAVIETGGVDCTNCVFGGDDFQTLYLTEDKQEALLATRWPVPGQRRYSRSLC